MDYTKVPRALIYKDRTNLNDFGVQTPGTINNYLFTQMRRMTLLHCGDAKEIALQCFNNAYYICTLTQLDEFPDLCMDKYEKKLMEVKIPFPGDVYQASMALVCMLLAAFDDKYKQKDDPLIESIHHWTSSNKWVGSNCRKSFDDINEKCSPDGFSVSSDMFAPRNIIDVIENVDVNDLAVGVIYVCKGLALLNDSNLRLYGANLAIARLNDDLQKIYEDWGYDPETKKFVPEMNDPLGVDPDEYELFDKITLLKKKAVDYIIEHYPAMEEDDSKEKDAESPQVSEAEVLQSKIRELESKLTLQVKEQMEANKINSQQATRIKELEAEVIPIKDLEADLEELRKWNQLSREQVALFCHALAEYCEFVKKTKKKDIAPMAHGLFGIGIKSAYNLMVSGYSKEDREHVAKIFETIWPPFANFILNTFDKKEQQLKQ